MKTRRKILYVDGDKIPIAFFSSRPVEKVERVAGRIPTASYVTKQSGLEQLANKIRSILA